MDTKQNTYWISGGLLTLGLVYYLVVAGFFGVSWFGQIPLLGAVFSDGSADELIKQGDYYFNGGEYDLDKAKKYYGNYYCN